MKHTLATLITLILLTACTSAPTPTLILTATVLPTATAKSTPTITSAPTLVPPNTVASTRILTLTSTATSTVTPPSTYTIPSSVSNITLRGLTTVRDKSGADYNIRTMRVDLRDGRVMFLGIYSRVVSGSIGSGCSTRTQGNVLIYADGIGESFAQRTPDFYFDLSPTGYPTYNPIDSGCEKIDGSYTGKKPSEPDIALALSVNDYIAHAFSRDLVFAVGSATPTCVPSR